MPKVHASMRPPRSRQSRVLAVFAGAGDATVVGVAPAFAQVEVHSPDATPGGFGPFPKGVDNLAFPAVQAYSDGKVVRWNQPQAAGQEEPEHPVPVLALSVQNAHEATAAQPSPSVAVSAVSAENSDAVARVLAGIALAVGLVAMVVTLVRQRT